MGGEGGVFVKNKKNLISYFVRLNRGIDMRAGVERRMCSFLNLLVGDLSRPSCLVILIFHVSFFL